MKTAQQHQDQAKQHILEAINHLRAIVIDKAPGYEEIPPARRAAMYEMMIALIEVREGLR